MLTNQVFAISLLREECSRRSNHNQLRIKNYRWRSFFLQLKCWNESQHTETIETGFLLTVKHDGNCPLNLLTAKTCFLYFKLHKTSHHLPRSRITFINKRWWLVTSIAWARELNIFYKSNSILYNFLKNENQELRITFICQLISLFFWSIFKKAKESGVSIAWREEV